MRKHKQALFENLIYAIVWLIVFLYPVFEYRHASETQWSIILDDWLLLLPFFVLFLLHNYVLVPFLFLRKKYGFYLILCASLIGLFLQFQRHPSFGEPREPRTPPSGERMRPPHLPEDEAFRPHPEEKDGHNPPDVPFVHRGFMMEASLLFLLITFNLMVRLFFKNASDQAYLKEMERYSLKMELENLKHQINPHFFMNTLNNIHALMDIDPEKAKDTVIDLSKMMRHVLYEANNPAVPLGKEIQFIQNYISLMSIRCAKEIDIQVSIPEKYPDIQIPPLLFISYIENAFKHGISYLSPSFIHISLEIHDKDIRFFVQNSLHPRKTTDHKGVGMENTKKRLDLLYGGKYSLTTTEVNRTFCVILIIPTV